jgi:predicted PurR-regulated permease PerM
MNTTQGLPDLMTLQNQIKIWLGLLVFSIVALWLFRGILLPFIAGMILAYLLNPLVNLLQRWRFNRNWATALVLFTVIALLVGVLLLIMPLVISQAIGLAQRLPGYATELQELGKQWLPALNEWLGLERAQQVERGIADLLTNILGFTAGLTGMLAQSGFSIIGTLGLAVITPVVAFYLLLDWEGMVRGVDNLLPMDHRSEIQGIFKEIDRSMAGVIRGQGSVVLILSLYYSISLSLTGLNFGLAIGLIAGFLSFVPYVGFITGFVLSIGIALVQFWPNWVMVVVVFMVYVIGQFIEGNILYPKLVGSSIGINPVWLMFSLFAFALMFGFVGVLLAVPLSAIAAVLTRFIIRKYRESTLYLGHNGENGGDTNPTA